MNPTAANEQSSYRYPGVTPFTTEQAPVFFGRKQDTDDLYRLIRREPLVVLYGKSGLGKSSLLNAGIIPRCMAEGTYNPLVIRFGAWVEGATATPLDITKTALAKDYEQATFLDGLLPGDTSLWHHAKTRQLNAPLGQGGGRPLLLFDQFEELFSYPAEQVQAFQEELSELLNTNIPLRFQRLAEASTTLTEEEEDLLETPLEARIVFAIRSDRMHLLDRLKDYLPNVLRYCFELKALNPKDAEEAILQPAQATGNFLTSQFTYSPAAMQKLLDFLTDHQDGRIEGILLQMLCEHYERQLVEKQGLTKLTTKEVGHPEEVVEKYYEEKINSLPEPQRLPARKLIEDGLVSEGEAMRLSLHESYILHEFGVDKALLERLVDSRLLRSEPFLRGGYTFELSHDRLVPAVLNERRKRREEDAKKEAELLELKRINELEEAQRIAEHERKLREQAEKGEQRARQRTRLAWILSALSVALAVFAYILLREAVKSEGKAKGASEAALFQKKEAERQKMIADSNANVAFTQQIIADSISKIALLEKDKAENNARLAQLQYVRAEDALRKAEAEAIKADSALKKYEQEKAEREANQYKKLLVDAKIFMASGDYHMAKVRLQSALKLLPDDEETINLLKQCEQKQ